MENENQDVALENNEANSEEAQTETSAREQELEVQLEKQKQITQRYKNKSKKDTGSDISKEIKSDDSLVQKAYLRSAQIVDSDEVELALDTAKKWGVTVDILVDDEDFKVKLEKLRISKSNELATSNVKSNATTNESKNTPEHWIAKGVPPTREQVTDRKTRAKIARAMIEKAGTGGKTFYND